MRIGGGTIRSEELIWVKGMGCSHPDGVTEGLACDADIGVGRPALYLRECFENKRLEEAVREIFEKVRGGYSCAAEYEGDVYVFRDPVGIKPLYYGGESFFSEETAATPVRLLPGELVRLPSTTVTRYSIEEIPATDPEILLTSLSDSVRFYVGKDAAILYSGGIDSALLASLSDVPVITFGVEGSPDLLCARGSARSLEKEYIEVVITERDIRKSIPEVFSTIGGGTLLDIEIGLLLFFVCRTWEKKVLISGQGADELFGGYLKYEKAFQAKEDVRTLMRCDVDHLYQGLERDWLMAEHYSKYIRYPYLDLSFLKRALGIPLNLLFSPGRKAFLRQMGALLSLPDTILQRPKKALQYGTGIHKVVRKYKRDGPSGPISRG